MGIEIQPQFCLFPNAYTYKLKSHLMQVGSEVQTLWLITTEI